jgi:O-antigen/teichoic acid export membrane protein
VNAATHGRVLRLLSTAVLDQVLLSGTNFLVGLVLLRFTSNADYALYVLVQSALLLLVSAQSAWIGGPLYVIAPKKPPKLRREMISAVKDSQRRILRFAVAAALLVPATGMVMGRCGTLTACVIVGAILAGWAALRREYLRIVFFVYSRPHALLGADSIYAGVLLTGMLWASFGTKEPIIWITAALTVAAWTGTAVADRALARDPGWVTSDAAPAWREMRTLGLWALVGAMIYWLFAQSYSFVLASRLDLKAVTDVNAARLMLMPAFLLTIGIQGVLAPMATAWNAEVGLRGLARRLLGIVIVLLMLDLLYFGVVWFFRDWLISDVLHKHIDNRDHLLLLWAAVALIGLIRDTLQCALMALGRLRSMASQLGLGAVLALLLMWFGISWWGAAAVLIGQIAGELVNLVGIVILLRAAWPHVVPAATLGCLPMDSERLPRTERADSAWPHD